MKILNLNQFNEKLKANQISLSDLKDVNIYNYYPKTKDELKQIIEERIKNEGPECDLNNIDVSNITDMSLLFYHIFRFNGDISKWNVSNVKDMHWMFRSSEFNGDISKWNVSKVTDMSNMFFNSEFNGDISKWNVSKVTDVSAMFDGCPLENNPPAWYKN